MASKSRDIEVYGFFFFAEQMHSWATVPPEYGTISGTSDQQEGQEMSKSDIIAL